MEINDYIKKIKNHNIKKLLKNIEITNLIKDIVINPPSEEPINKDVNDLPYTLALYYDKRGTFQIFYSLIIRKLELVNLFISNEKVKLMLICEYILSLLINFFFNALLYSDDVISNKYHNNGQLDIIVTIFLSISSNIITSIICYYINYSKYIDDRYDSIMTIKIEYYYLKNILIFFKYLKLKFIYFLICELIIIFGCFYYAVIFFIIYNKSIGSLIVNYLSSLFESFLTAIIISIMIVSTRKFGLVFSNKELYNTSKYINNYF
jgi:branched-subunit amino acid transport protein